jgi:hypothetical protein
MVAYKMAGYKAEGATHLLAPVLEILDERLLGQLKLGVLDLHGLAESLGLFSRVGERLAILGSGRSDGESALRCEMTVTERAGSGTGWMSGRT